MPDIKIQLNEDKYFNRYVDQVIRRAVLVPLKGPVTQANIFDSVRCLLSQWRTRVDTLSEFGWLNNTRTTSVFSARNCKPTFVETTPKTRVCGYRTLCPFCYGRWVLDIWLKLDAVLALPSLGDSNTGDDFDGPHITPVPTFHLIERKFTFYRNVTYPVNDWMDSLFQSLSEKRKSLVKAMNPSGAFMYTTIEPHNAGTEWRIQHRQLFKVPVHYKIPFGLTAGTTGRIRRHEQPTRRKLNKMVSRMCYYPTALLTGDSERVVQYLEAKKLSKFRSYEFFRNFRSSKEY